MAIDWTRLRGTGRTGRVREKDIRAAAQTAAPPAAAEEDEAVPVTPTRRTIAERMMHGVRSTAPVTLTATADATNLVNLRRQFQADLGFHYTLGHDCGRSGANRSGLDDGGDARLQGGLYR